MLKRPRDNRGRKKIDSPLTYDPRVVLDVSENAIAVSSLSEGVADAKNPYDFDFSPICDRIAIKSAAADSTKIKKAFPKN